MKDLVSIIIPVYNSHKYIKKCVNSILTQDYKNIEVICIDDGSKDNSVEILRTYEKKDSRLKVIPKGNAGVSQTRNAGIDLAAGDWIMFVDSDDYIEKQTVSRLINAAEQSEADVVIGEYFYHLHKIEKEGKFLNISQLTIFEKQEKTQLIEGCIDPHAVGMASSITNIGVPWGKLYKKDFFENKEIRFDKRISNMEDMLLNIKIFAKADKIAYLPVSLYHYIIRENSLVSRYDSNYENSACIIMKELEKYANANFNSHELDKVLKYKSFCLFYECIRKSILIKESRYKTFNSKVKAIKKLSKSTLLNGKYQRDIKDWYSKAQLIYGILLRMKCYAGLTLLMDSLQKIKKRRNQYR